MTAQLAYVALMKAQEQARSIQLFFVLEAAFLIVAIFLGTFVLRKNKKNLPHPTRFLVFMTLILAATGFLTLYWGVGHLLFALAFSAGLFLSMLDPVAAVGFLIANLLIRPWEMANMTEMGFIPKTLGGLALLSWIVHSAGAKQLALSFHWPSRIFFALTAWFLISALTVGDFMDGLLDYSSTMLISSIIFILISNAPKMILDVKILEDILVIAITASIAHAILVTVTQAGYDPSEHRLQTTGAVGNSNDLAALIVQAIPIALIPLFESPIKRLWILIVIPVLLTGLWLSQSRGAMLAVLVSTGTYFILRAKNRRRALAFGVLGIPLLFAVSTALNFAREAEDLRGSTESRTAFLKAGINMGIRNPILGVGFGNFKKEWQSYAVGSVVETGVRTAHNSWILAFAEAGFPGLLLFAGLAVAVFRRALTVQPFHPELVSALAGYSVAMTFLSHTYTVYPYLIFGLILAASKIHGTQGAMV